MSDLTQLREAIDAVDRTLVAALNERARIAREIGQYKKSHALPVLDAAREQSLLDKIAELNQGDLPETSLKDIYRAILAASRKLQEDL